MDQRTRERLPALPALVARVHAQAQAGAERLAAAQAVAAGEEFTCRGEVFHRAPVCSGPTAKTWSEDPVTGARRDLSGEEDRAFWRADELARMAPKRGWQRLSAGEGSKDHCLYDWLLIDPGTDDHEAYSGQHYRSCETHLELQRSDVDQDR